MIFDRTQEDVNASRQIINNTKSVSQLTEQDKLQLERGTLTINTLNRIEEKQSELQQKFNELGYWNTKITNRTWTFTDIFKSSDFERIHHNTDVLKNAFFVYQSTPDIPDKNYRKYQTINAIEKILHDLQEMIICVEELFAECGNLECGEI
jgi:hypothetical protein